MPCPAGDLIDAARRGPGSRGAPAAFTVARFRRCHPLAFSSPDHRGRARRPRSGARSRCCPACRWRASTRRKSAARPAGRASGSSRSADRTARLATAGAPGGPRVGRYTVHVAELETLLSQLEPSSDVGLLVVDEIGKMGASRPRSSPPRDGRSPPPCPSSEPWRSSAAASSRRRSGRRGSWCSPCRRSAGTSSRRSTPLGFERRAPSPLSPRAAPRHIPAGAGGAP